jgi:oligopeptide/dipeptide ABC transporter ATP-binding protein
MYAGKIVEAGSVTDVLDRPQHPYTRGLLGSVPSANERGARLKQIRGMTPSLLSIGAGCAFRERCDHRQAACEVMPKMTNGEHENAHHVRCFFPLTTHVDKNIEMSMP